MRAYLLLLILQGSCWLKSHGLPISDVAQERAKRQNIFREWTISKWSECTFSCGSGFQVRSVRCLDEDGVISTDCDNDNRPDSYEFCGQVDCNTNAPTPDVLPENGVYNFVSGDGTATVLSLDNQGGGQYVVQQNTTESDLTMTILEQTVTQTQIPQGIQTQSVQILGRDNMISLQGGGGMTSLVVNGDSILELNDAQLQVRFLEGQGINYNEGTISGLPEGSTIDDGVNCLYFYDSFRFYKFDSNKINDLPGPGTLYFNPVTDTALYSVDLNFNGLLDTVLSTLEPKVTDSPSVTPSEATNPPTTSEVATPDPSSPSTEEPTPDLSSPLTEEPTPDPNPPSTEEATPNPTSQTTEEVETEEPTTEETEKNQKFQNPVHQNRKQRVDPQRNLRRKERANVLEAKTQQTMNVQRKAAEKYQVQAVKLASHRHRLQIKIKILAKNPQEADPSGGTVGGAVAKGSK